VEEGDKQVGKIDEQATKSREALEFKYIQILEQRIKALQSDSSTSTE